MLPTSITSNHNLVLYPPSHEAVELVPADVNLAPLRIILIVPPIGRTILSENGTQYDAQKLSDVFTSLRAADYGDQSIDLHVIILPHAELKTSERTYAVASSFIWPHGHLTMAKGTTAGRFEHGTTAWDPPHGASDAVAIVEADRVAPLSRNWYRFVMSARKRHGHRADIIAFAVEPVRPRGDIVPPTQTGQDRDVFLWQGVYDNGVIVPASSDKWRAFLRWFQRQRGNWYLWPSVIGVRDKRDERWANFHSNTYASWTLWLSRFSALHGVYTLYPRREHPAALPIVRSGGMLRIEGVLRLALDASVVDHAKGSRISDESVHRIVDLGRKHGGVVSLTIINKAFLETARSWICNVDVGGFRPPGIVWITTDDEAYEGLRDIPDSYALRVSEMRGARRSTSFGTPDYWLLMMERTMLIRDILNHGIGVFAFETDQVWLRNPVPYIDRVLHSGDDVDIVGTIDSSHDIGGNFLFLNPTLPTRKVWDEVSRRFEYAYEAQDLDHRSKNSRVIIENDQTLLTKLVLFEEPFRSRYPTVFRALDTDLFVSGRWYDGGKRFYSSPKSRSPIVINNNFIEGIRRKTVRLKRHAHWFWRDGQCDRERVKSAIKQNEYRAIKAGLTAGQQSNSLPTEARVITGSDTEADIEMAISALNTEREDAQTAFLDLKKPSMVSTMIKWMYETLWKWRASKPPSF